MGRIEKAVRNAIDEHPLKQALLNNHHYYADFVEAANSICNSFSNNQFRSFIDKFKVNKGYDYWQYLQSASELTVLYYIKRYYNNGFNYEPKLNENSNMNPECSFLDNGIQVNVEVKCPNLQKRIEQESSPKLKVSLGHRIPGLGGDGKVNKIFRSDERNSPIQLVERLDTKLRSFIENAQKKFPESTDKNFNILVISADILGDMDDFYSGLFGLEGAFTEQSFITNEYDRIDAIMLTNIMSGHINWAKQDSDTWHLEQYVNILLLNPDRQESETGKYYFKNGGAMLFGRTTADFLDFLRKLDEEDKAKKETIDGKLATEARIITQFCSYLRTKTGED